MYLACFVTQGFLQGLNINYEECHTRFLARN